MGPFGGPVRFHVGDGQDGSSRLTPAQDMALVRETLTAVADGEDGLLRLYRPRPTAAFSPLDTASQGYGLACEAMRGLGFSPVERRAGGRLAVYDGNALVIDLVAHHPDPRESVRVRYERFARSLVSALGALSIDARVGDIPGEYCPGEFSVNSGGCIKIAGLAQRIGRRGYHVGCVVFVFPSEAARTAVAEAYRILGIAFHPETFGSVSSAVPGISFAGLRNRLCEAIADMLQE